MRILHSSDWHLGRSLLNRRRYEEFDAFLNWLAQTIAAEKIDILVVAGDIFDTTLPSNRAQEQYYKFLTQIALGGVCKNIIIIGGNHDSPSLLNAPAALLKALNIHVVGAKSENPDDDIIIVRDNGAPLAIICAVPYLRDRDVREIAAGESFEQKQEKLITGIAQHYQQICEAARLKRQELGGNIPIIATGHLFAEGGKTADGDGVRELYVGSLMRVGAEIFPPFVDYVALGHLHVPQMVGNQARIRYSGSPLPMGFGEAGQQKQVIIVDFIPQMQISEINIPCFRKLASIKGDLDDIARAINDLKAENANIWLEVEYEGKEYVNDLPETINQMLSGSQIEVLRIKNVLALSAILTQFDSAASLEELNELEVFDKFLSLKEIDDAESLKPAYQQIIQQIKETDCQEI